MATINLGAIKFNWKGAYNNSTAYAVDDVVSSGGSSYVCILASTGNAVSNGTYWSVMAQAGTNGTDVGTTLTTQGDILYRDGSGLQRLAKGTANQLLQINSGATAPEWTTFSSSDYVKVAEGSVTTDSTWDFASTIFDNSIYMNYDFFINARAPGGASGGNGELRLIDQSGNNTTDSHTSSNEVYMNSSSTNVNGGTRDAADSIVWMRDGVRDGHGQYMFTVQGMGKAESKNFNGFSNRPNQDGFMRLLTTWYSGYMYAQQATNWGIRCQFPANMTGTYKIFGRK